MILSNSPAFGSRGIFTDWEMQRPPKKGQGGGKGGNQEKLKLKYQQELQVHYPTFHESVCTVRTTQVKSDIWKVTRIFK